MILTQLFKHSVQIPIIRNIRAGLKTMLDSSVLINGFLFQSPEIFGSEFSKVFMIIQSRVTVRALTVTLMDNPGSVVIDQGAEPISAPCLLILNIHGLCTLYVLVYVGMMSQSSVIPYY